MKSLSFLTAVTVFVTVQAFASECLLDKRVLSVIEPQNLTAIPTKMSAK